MVEFLNRYVSLEKEATYGTEPSGSPIYGEVDDESLATKHDLLDKARHEQTDNRQVRDRFRIL